MMQRLVLAAGAAALLAACGSTPQTPQSGSLIGPTGLAVTAAGDRDLLFVASTGSEQLRALQMCTVPNLPDGGTDPTNTCPPTEDLQFLPGPVRLFPASIETGDRPLRLAGARLDLPDGGAGGGVVLAAGADDTLRIVDARNLVQTVKHLETAAPVRTLPLDAGVATDVVAANPVDGSGMELSAPMVRAFAATAAGPGLPAQLMVLEARLDAADAGTSVPHLEVVQRCGLDPVLPRRLAVAPGDDTAVVIADGAGDGALRVKRLDIPASSGPLQACVGTRLRAGGPVRSVTLSSAWYEDGQPDHAAGEIAALIREDGGILFLRTNDGQIFPVPPFGYSETGKQPMEPLYVSGLAREAVFLRSVKPNRLDANACQKAPCTPLWVGAGTTGKVHTFNLLLAVTSSDGATTMIDPLLRRYVDPDYYSNQALLQPSIDQQPLLIPTPAAGTAPSKLTFEPANPDQPGHTNVGWLNAGVTQKMRWRVLWQSPLPGLERHGGTVTPGASGTLIYRAQPPDLLNYETDPLLRLGVGDVVSFAAYSVPSGAPADCNPLASEPGLRFALPILAISSDGNTLTLGTTPVNNGSASGFPFTCAKFGVAAELRTAGDRPWLVYEGGEVRGRAKNGETFEAAGRRFNYPLDYDSTKLASTVNVSVAFKLEGTDPTVPGTLWTFSLNSNQFPQQIFDPNSSQGLATQVISFTSRRAVNRLFISLTGSNALLQAAPEALGIAGGLLAYR
jgi:hypothetical protein